jgi:heme/copper-type cytochrome/quinol oxidase subunit 2
MSTDYNPFQSPAAPFQPGGGPAWPIIPFQSGHQRATIAIALLAMSALVCLARCIAASISYTSLQQLPDGSFALTGNGAAIAEGNASLSIAAMFVLLATIVAFAMWTHRAARNLPALGARGLKYTPGWAVGWFFIPLAHLVMPYFVASEIWRESDPAQKHLDGQGGKAASPLVAGWWIAYVVHVYLPVVMGGIFGGIVGYMAASRRHATPQQIVHEVNHYLPTFLLLTVVAQALGVLAAILAIMYVRRVDANQEAIFEQSLGEGFTA